MRKRAQPTTPKASWNTYAIHRANRQAQLAPGAMRLDHGVHQLVAAQYRVGRAGVDAQGAADAPVFVDDGDAARTFCAIGRVECHDGLPCDGCKPANALAAARRALVDGCAVLRNGAGVGSAVRVAAARALRLRQRREDLIGEEGALGGAHAAVTFCESISRLV